MEQLPARIAFVDVETTGLTQYDRVVSLGLIMLNTLALARDELDVGCIHVVFDPDYKTHPEAEAIHGYNAWTLRHQERFEVRAPELKPYLDAADLIVAHHAAFDMRFLVREFRKSGHPLGVVATACTMEMFRERCGGSASLDNALARAGLAVHRARHCPLQDAWFAMQLFFWLRGIDPPPLERMPQHRPQNWREPPPMPPGKLPRRKTHWRAGDPGPNAHVPATARFASRLRRGRPIEAGLGRE